MWKLEKSDGYRIIFILLSFLVIIASRISSRNSHRRCIPMPTYKTEHEYRAACVIPAHVRPAQMTPEQQRHQHNVQIIVCAVSLDAVQNTSLDFRVLGAHERAPRLLSRCTLGWHRRARTRTTTVESRAVASWSHRTHVHHASDHTHSSLSVIFILCRKTEVKAPDNQPHSNERARATHLLLHYVVYIL